MGENQDPVDTATPSKLPVPSDPVINSENSASMVLENGPIQESSEGAVPSTSSEEIGRTAERFEWRETSDSGDLSIEKPTSDVPTSGVEAEKGEDEVVPDVEMSKLTLPADTTSQALPESANAANDPISSGPSSQPQSSVTGVGNDEHDKKAIENDS